MRRVSYFPPMTAITKFATPEEAHLLRMYLADRGIEAFLFDEHIVQLFWHLSQAFGGVRVMVRDEDLAAAEEALGEYRSALGPRPLPENEVRAWPVVAAVSLLLGVPLLLFGRRGRGNGAGEKRPR